MVDIKDTDQHGSNEIGVDVHRGPEASTQQTPEREHIQHRPYPEDPFTMEALREHTGYSLSPDHLYNPAYRHVDLTLEKALADVENQRGDRSEHKAEVLQKYFDYIFHCVSLLASTSIFC